MAIRHNLITDFICNLFIINELRQFYFGKKVGCLMLIVPKVRLGVSDTKSCVMLLIMEIDI